MPELVYYLIAGFFLPLFPLSMVFNALFGWAEHVLLRTVILLAWPQIGLVLVRTTDAPLPDWVTVLAMGTSALYAFRAIALREVGEWLAFVATSLWALLWLFVSMDMPMSLVHLHTLGLSVPLVLLAILTAGLTRRFGAAYTRLYGGLAQSMPRFAGVLVFVVLAIIATPLFPAFFTMMTLIADSALSDPYMAVGLLLIWLLWSWAGAQLLQGLIVGPTTENGTPDLSPAVTWTFAVVLLALALGATYAMGVQL